jgi:hypothetical protein
MQQRVRKVRLSVGSIGGAVAIAASVAGVVSQLMTGGPLSNVTGLTLLLVFVAGGIALARPNLVEALAVADVLVAIALLMEMFGRLGALYLPALLLLVVATMRADHLPDRKTPTMPLRATRPLSGPMLASQWDRMHQARADAFRETASAESLRRAG